MDDRDEYEPEGEDLADPVTERVRIIGAEQAGSASAGHEPLGATAGPSAVGGASLGAPSHPPAYRGEPAAATDAAEPAPAPEMPHWTDPPTGQVPAVLDRSGGDEDRQGQWSASMDAGPAWREHEHEWADSAFDPSLLADEHTRMGALDDTPLEERQPWEFDDLATPRRDTEAPAWLDDAVADTPHAGPRPRVVPLGSSDAAEAGVLTDTPAGHPSPTADTAVGAGPNGVTSISSSPLRGTHDRSPAAGGARSRRRGRRGGATPSPGGGRSGRNVPLAIATGVGFALVAVACFELGSVATLVLATVVVTVAAAEAFAALRRSGSHPATLLGLVATAAVMVAAYTRGIAADPLVCALLVIASMVWYLVGSERGSPVQGIAATVLGFMWVGLLGSFAALTLAPSQYPHRHGVAFVFGAVVATVAADVGALAIGGWRGRHPMAPRVSPRKTWEGLIGGTVLAVAASAAITGQVHPWTPAKAAILGVVVAVVAPIGDLSESLIKRDLGLKDMGSVLPGHGGVLDRIDALLFVLPATYYLVRVLHLG